MNNNVNLNLLNIVDLESKIVDNDLKIFRTALSQILNIKPIIVNDKNYISLDEVVNICDNCFKGLSSKQNI